MAFAWKLLTLLAVLLMPLGMTGAHAATSHEAARVDMPMGHCPDQGSGHETQGGIAACTMACAAALPAFAASADDALPSISVLAVSAHVPALHGLHPEIATPPPKCA